MASEIEWAIHYVQVSDEVAQYLASQGKIKVCLNPSHDPSVTVYHPNGMNFDITKKVIQQWIADATLIIQEKQDEQSELAGEGPPDGA